MSIENVENKEVNTECGLCHKCAYKGSVPGSAHISCGLDWDSSMHRMPSASLHAFNNGWYYFPANFDPVWQESPCQEFSTEKDPDKVSKHANDPFMQLMSMLRKR